MTKACDTNISGRKDLFLLIFSGHYDKESMADQFHSCKIECVAESVHIVVDQKAERIIGTSEGFTFKDPLLVTYFLQLGPIS